jgi:hypothetical protein
MSDMSNENNRYPKYVEVPSKQVNLAGSSGWSVAKTADVFRKRLNLKLCLAVVLAMVLVLIAGVVSVRVINSDRTPEAAVSEYVQLIADGKYDAASKLVDPGANSYQRRLLSDKAYSGVKGAVKVSSITVQERNSSTVNVRVSLRVKDKSVNQTLQVKLDESDWLVHNWKIVTPLVTHLAITPEDEFFKSYKIGSVVVDSSLEADGKFNYLVYPGVYNVEVQSANPEYFATSLSSKQVVVADNDAESFNESTTQIDASVEPTEKLKGWALSKVQEKVKSCTSEVDRRDLVCPFYLRLGDLNEIAVKTLPSNLDSISLYKYRNEYKRNYGFRTIFVVRATNIYTAKPAYKSYSENGSYDYRAGEVKDVRSEIVGYIYFDASGQPGIAWGYSSKNQELQ